MVLAETPETLVLPELVQQYVNRISSDPLTSQNIPVVIGLLHKIQEAEKMSELEEKLSGHGKSGFLSPYNEIVNSSGVILAEPGYDGRSITLMNDKRAEEVEGLLK